MKDKLAMYVVVREDTNRIVMRKAGTHATMEALCKRLDERYGNVYFYDDACVAHRYLPMDGPPLNV